MFYTGVLLDSCVIAQKINARRRLAHLAFEELKREQSHHNERPMKVKIYLMGIQWGQLCNTLEER